MWKSSSKFKNEGENKVKVGLKTIVLPAYFDNDEQFSNFGVLHNTRKLEK